MPSERTVITLNNEQMEVLSHVQLSSLMTGRGLRDILSLEEIIRSLIYFSSIAIRTVTGELNSLLAMAMEMRKKKMYPDSSAPEDAEQKVQKEEVDYELQEDDERNIGQIVELLKNNGLDKINKPNEIASICIDLILKREGFDGTLKKKFLDAMFVASMYSLRPVTVLKILNEHSGNITFTDEEKAIMGKIYDEYQKFEGFRLDLFARPEGFHEANVILQKYGEEGKPNERKPGAKDSITLTENDMTLDWFINRMRKFRSQITPLDFQSALLGYAMLVLSWTDNTQNLPYVSKRLFSLTYPEPVKRITISREIQRRGQEFPYQKVIQTFRDFGDAYSYAAWSLLPFLADFYKACRALR